MLAAHGCAVHLQVEHLLDWIRHGAALRGERWRKRRLRRWHGFSKNMGIDLAIKQFGRLFDIIL
jgi:hypothetical protein